MKKNLFWTIWGLATLICVMVAGFKSFAHELEQEKKTAIQKAQNSRPKFYRTQND
jgi:hypothetical protein